MGRRIDLDRALGWTGPGLIRTAHQSAAAGLEASLAGLGFHVRELEGERVVSPESFMAEVARGLGLEDRPPDWEAFARARRSADLPDPLAVMWNRADHSAFFNLKAVIEAATAFLAWDRERAADGGQVALFLLGQTRDYPRPSPG
jgi:hypothetical protein